MEKIQLQDITFGQEQVADPAPSPEFGPGRIGPGKQVTMHFALTLIEGAVVDSNFDSSPVTFFVGDGNILPGFELAIFGMQAGEERSVRVPAANAFGLSNPDNIQRIPRYRFPADLVMESGLVVNFTDAAGNDQPAVITDCDASLVTVDFNHPLADRDILFRVKVLAVTEPE